jgi:hypothetical protein
MDSGGVFTLQNQSISVTGTLGDIKLGQKAAMTWAQLRSRYPLASAPNNTASDFVPAAPFKKVFSALTAADSFDLTAAPLSSSPALVVGTLRVTAATANTGVYIVTDSGGTAAAPAGGAPGVALLSDDGHTVTFPTGSLVTAFVIEYVPTDPVSVGGSILTNNSP